MTNPPTPREQAAQLADGMFKLLSDPDRWCRTYLAVDAAGMALGPNDEGACAWCILGAEEKVSQQLFGESDVRNPAIGEFYSVIIRRVPHGHIGGFNDNPWTSHPDILMLLRDVADELRKA